MTNAEKYVKDIDWLADAIYKTDEFEEACSMKYDEQQGELVGCKHNGMQNSCVLCIKEWLLKEDN